MRPRGPAGARPPARVAHARRGAGRLALSADIAALAALPPRGSAGPGERGAAAWVAGRLREAGAQDVVVEPFTWPRTYAWAHLAHVAAAALVGPLALPSFELEVSGRGPWVHRLLPRGEGANVVARVRGAGTRTRTVVLVAHLDAARTGLIWRVGARLRTPVGAPAVAPVALGMLLGRRRAGRVLLALAAAMYLDTARSPTVPGANDDATGVAALIELTRRLAAAPVPGADVLVVATGAEEAGMGGMRAFLAAHLPELPPDATFVLNLDTLGSGTPAVLTGEATLLPHAYRPQDVARVPAPRRVRSGTFTDGMLARFAGLPAATLVSIGPDGRYANYHLPTDTPDRVDLACVEACVDLAEQAVRAG